MYVTYMYSTYVFIWNKNSSFSHFTIIKIRFFPAELSRKLQLLATISQ